MAVGLSPSSRGGSVYVHQALQVGQRLRIGSPRNLFEMANDPDPVLLIAGGIGVTPLLAMARERQRRQWPWQMVYAARSRAHAAYVDDLAAHGGAVAFHFDDEHQGEPIDLTPLLQVVSAQTHIYCCGPRPLMDRVRELAAHHPSARLHFESFGADAPSPASDNRPFIVTLARQGKTITVGEHQSILDALEAHDVVVPSVCKEGICGSCECAVLEGEIDHRDQILSPEEMAGHHTMMVCVSRAKGERLVLDI